MRRSTYSTDQTSRLHLGAGQSPQGYNDNLRSEVQLVADCGDHLSDQASGRFGRLTLKDQAKIGQGRGFEDFHSELDNLLVTPHDVLDSTGINIVPVNDHHIIRSPHDATLEAQPGPTARARLRVGDDPVPRAIADDGAAPPAEIGDNKLAFHAWRHRPAVLVHDLGNKLCLQNVDATGAWHALDSA
jgi:hypothetical protein